MAAAAPPQSRSWGNRARVALVDGGRTLCVAERHEVKLASAATGERLAQLRGGHSTAICSLSLSPWSALQLLTCDTAGCVCVWDLAEAALLRRYELTQVERLSGAFAVVNTSGGAEAWPSRQWKVVRFACVGGDAFDAAGQPALFQSNGSACRELQAGSGATSGLVAALSRRTVLVHDLATGKQHKLPCSRRADLTALALSPAEPLVAAGDGEGLLHLVRPSGGSFARHVATAWHWHSSAVAAVCFSSDGAQLLSGGREAVLVLWQVDSGARTFLPRLGAEIAGLACGQDGAWHAAALANGAVRLVDARSWTLGATVVGNKSSAGGAQSLAPPQTQPPPQQHQQQSQEHQHKQPLSQQQQQQLLLRRARERLGLVLEPRSGAAVMQRTPGVLSLVDLRAERELASIDVANQNVVSGDDHVAAVAVVELCAFAPGKGKRMATVERKETKSVLRFWVFDRTAAVPGAGGHDDAGSSGQWLLMTQVEQPHEDEVTMLAFHPAGDIAVTCSRDKTFKVWELAEVAAAPGSGSGLARAGQPPPSQQQQPQQQPQQQWRCRSVGFYNNAPLRGGALSPDGSLLAAASEGTVTLWSVAGNRLIAALPQPPHRAGLLQFFRRGTLLACASDDGSLTCWDVLQRRVKWQLQLGGGPGGRRGAVRSMAACPRSERLLVAAGAGGRLLLVFAGDSPVPVLARAAGEPHEVGVVVGVAFGGRARAAGHDLSDAASGSAAEEGEEDLLVATDRGNIVVVRATSGDAAPVSERWQQLLQQPMNAFASLNQLSAAFVPRHAAVAGEHSKLKLAAASAEVVGALDAYPSYVLPPLSKLVRSLLAVEGDDKQRQEEHVGPAAAQPAEANAKVEAVPRPSNKKRKLADKSPRAADDQAVLAGLQAFFMQAMK